MTIKTINSSPLIELRSRRGLNVLVQVTGTAFRKPWFVGASWMQK